MQINACAKTLLCCEVVAKGRVINCATRRRRKIGGYGENSAQQFSAYAKSVSMVNVRA